MLSRKFCCLIVFISFCFIEPVFGAGMNCYKLNYQPQPIGTMCNAASGEFVRLKNGWFSTSTGRTWFTEEAKANLNFEESVQYCLERGQVVPSFEDMQSAYHNGLRWLTPVMNPYAFMKFWTAPTISDLDDYVTVLASGNGSLGAGIKAWRGTKDEVIAALCVSPLSE